LRRQQESKPSLWTDNKRLPADEESWGGQLLSSPLTLTAREAGPTRFLSGFYGPQLWSNRSQGRSKGHQGTSFSSLRQL
jgi:hypothetical protein